MFIGTLDGAATASGGTWGFLEQPGLQRQVELMLKGCSAKWEYDILIKNAGAI
jgi:hypothetical protein